MPRAAPRPCNHPGCPKLTTTGRCEDHPKKHGWKHNRERGTAHQRGYGAKWQKLRLRILERDNFLCQPCYTKGYMTPAKEVDHIKRKEDGGTDAENNLQAICVACHRKKTARE